MWSKEDVIEQTGKSDLFDTIYDRCNKKCILCYKTNDLVIHSPLNASTMKNVDANELVLLCSSCAYKIEQNSKSQYRDFLSGHLWNKIYSSQIMKEHKATKFALSSYRNLNHMKRFASSVSYMDEYLASHLFWVPLLSLYIAEDYIEENEQKNIDYKKLMIMGLNHDIPEIWTTDIVSPVKKSNPILSSSFEELEKKICSKIEEETNSVFLSSSIDEFNKRETIEAKISNLADSISAMMFSVEEAFLGNQDYFLVVQRFYHAFTHPKDKELWELNVFLDMKKLLETIFSKEFLCPNREDSEWSV